MNDSIINRSCKAETGKIGKRPEKSLICRQSGGDRGKINLTRPNQSPGELTGIEHMHVFLEILGKQFFFGVEPYRSAPEVFGHFLETRKGKIDKGPLLIKSAFEENRMIMVEFPMWETARIPPKHIPESMMSYNHT